MPLKECEITHTQILGKTEFAVRFNGNFKPQSEEMTLVSVNLQNWIEFMDTSVDVQKEIIMKTGKISDMIYHKNTIF